MTQSIMRFFNLMQAVKEATPAWPELNAVEDKLLQLLAAKWHSGESVAILDIVTANSGLSESTIQRHLGTMKTKGVIKLEASTIDGRSKVIQPTQLTIDYFTKLDSIL